MRDLQSENKKYQQCYIENSKKINELKVEILGLEMVDAAAKAEIAEKAEKLQSLQNENQELSKYGDKIDAMVVCLNKDIAHIKDAHTVTKTELESMTQSCVEKECEIDSLKKQKEVLDTHVGETDPTIDQLKQEIRRIKDAHAATKKELESKVQLCVEKECEIKSLNDKNQKLINSNKRLQEEEAKAKEIMVRTEFFSIT